ncbi:hypothetical protein R3P38DRAFT_2763111 [Favolaschia claudopus]|uniref:Uncharacterized protein n=1 Tax=Favolaschia claudopus TaxID=2862362 RepID=A0AAW0DNU5_9AGAR
MCREIDEDGTTCSCEEYDAPTDPSAPSKCRECGHGRSRHGPAKPIQPPPSPPVADPPKPTIQAIFDIHANRRLSDAFPGTQRPGDAPATQAAVDPQTAMADALKGYRPSSKKHRSSSSSKPQTQSRTPKSRTSSATRPVVSKVILLTEGVSKGFALRSSSRALTPSEEQLRKSHGCVAYDVMISAEWTHEQATKQLATVFPKAFQAAQVQSNKNDWFLLEKFYQKLSVLDGCDLNPNGRTMVSKIQKKSNTTQTFLYLALRKRIDPEVYGTWYQPPKGHVPSSDIENISDPEDEKDSIFDSLDTQTTQTTPAASSRKRRYASTASISDDEPEETPAAKKQKLGA